MVRIKTCPWRCLGWFSSAHQGLIQTSSKAGCEGTPCFQQKKLWQKCTLEFLPWVIPLCKEGFKTDAINTVSASTRVPSWKQNLKLPKSRNPQQLDQLWRDRQQTKPARLVPAQPHIQPFLPGRRIPAAATSKGCTSPASRESPPALQTWHRSGSAIKKTPCGCEIPAQSPRSRAEKTQAGAPGRGGIAGLDPDCRICSTHPIRQMLPRGLGRKEVREGWTVLSHHRP